MILKYTKIDNKVLTKWYIDVKNFQRQLNELKRYKFVFLDDYEPNDPKQVVLSIDDGYQNILEYAAPLLKKYSIPFEFFIIGGQIGKDNRWDKNEPLVKICNIQELKKIVKLGGRLQWHTASHTNFFRVKSVQEIKRELFIPKDLLKLDKKGFKWLAYPYGIYTDEVVKIAKNTFKGAVSCTDGDDHNLFTLRRLTVRNQTSFKDASFAVNMMIDQIEADLERKIFLLAMSQKELSEIKSLPESILFQSLRHPKKAFKKFIIVLSGIILNGISQFFS